MSQHIEHIGRKDILWSYASAVFTVGAGVFLLPFILNKMTDETVGLYMIFLTITDLVLLLDFGFRPSFARTVSYIFSGGRSRQREGVEQVEAGSEVDYGLLRSTLSAMRRFYRWVALAVMALLATAGTAYILYVLRAYEGNRQEALTAWVLLIGINCYNLYTFYYDALLTGKGYIKRSQQIMILGQTVYICLAIVLLYAGGGLAAVTGAQLVSTLVRRWLTYRVFFTKELRRELAQAQESRSQTTGEVLQAISPNAIKVGLTGLGGFLVTKSAVLLSGAMLPLAVAASYGLTVKVMDILVRCGEVFYQSYTPKLAQCRAEHDMKRLGRYYKISILSLAGIFLLGGTCWMLWGNMALDLIHSNTHFIPEEMLLVLLVITFLEHNHSVSAGFIMADNKIPFFIPSLLSGAATIGLLLLFVKGLGLGVWGLILAPGLAQLAYQNWKWPSVIIRELKQAQ
ncbi:MAG: hypothetical protein KBS77_08065 [Bacteroidales bacterium]|nr:hypothetical protein [Candidatus Colicola faecequi]